MVEKKIEPLKKQFFNEPLWEGGLKEYFLIILFYI